MNCDCLKNDIKKLHVKIMVNYSVILILSHVINKSVRKLHEDIIASCSDNYDVIFLADNSKNIFSNYDKNKSFFLFSIDDLSGLNYPGKKHIAYDIKPLDDNYHKHRNFMMGNTELPILLFFRKNPGYRYYWVVEYDVRYTGSWLRFFSFFNDSDSDLISTSLIEYDSSSKWPRWTSMGFPDLEVSQKDYIKGFFPIYRISNKALKQLDDDYNTGAFGHYECLMPTLLKKAGLSLEDIGGDGKYVKNQNINLFYQNTPSANSHAPGTFVFRPSIYETGIKPNTLWHPVKYRPKWKIQLSKIKQFVLNLLIIKKYN